MTSMIKKTLKYILSLFVFVYIAQAAQQPNIVFIFSDDHALQAISAYGGRFKDIAPTPNIDRIAKEGAVFVNSYCANSICGPSRASVLTGKHSHINGFIDNNNPRFNGAQPTFPKYLQKAGYDTAMIGKWHLGTNPTGFNHWEILPDQGSYYNPHFIGMDGLKKQVIGYSTDIITEKSLDWLKGRKNAEKPFLLMCQHKAPHRNWVPAQRHYKLFEGVTMPEPETLFDKYENRSSALKKQEMSLEKDFWWEYDLLLPGKTLDPRFRNNIVNGEFHRMTPQQKLLFDQAYGNENQNLIDDLAAGKLSDTDVIRWKYQRYIKNYLRCIRAVDESVGCILNYLDESGLSKNTIVIYSSDQGFYLGEHGWYDKRWMFEESLAMPFIIRWPGVVKPATRSEALIQNIDYAPTFLEAAGLPIPTDIQGRSLLPVFKNNSISPPDWRKAIYYAYYGEGTHRVAAHDGVRTEQYKLFYLPATQEWQMFDLKNDPQEMRSLHDDSTRADLLSELKDLYKEIKFQYKAK